MKFGVKLAGMCIAIQASVFAQMDAENLKITKTAIGTSAISIHTITARTINLTLPIFNYSFDTLSNQLFFSARQKSESGGSQYLSKGFFGAFNSKTDSVKWVNESSLYNLSVSGNNLLLSNDVKTVRYNKAHGYDEIRYNSKIIYTTPAFNKGMMYSKTENDVLQGVNLSVGNVIWNCAMPRSEDWVDTKYLNDSVVLIAAKGLHAVNVKQGLLWSFPLSTATKTEKALVYSLAKYNTIQKISSVIRTTSDENVVTQIASNIIKDDKNVYFASKEKVIAVTHGGKLAWEVDLRNYPVSKMYLSKNDSVITLVNFGLATHGQNFVTWGKPFIISIDPANGKIINQFDLGDIDNLADFIQTDKSLIFAGKNSILEANPYSKNLKTIMDLNETKYGRFSEFINGNDYYTMKEGYFVPLNFINDNLIYFKADNNKIYGLDSAEFKYEYHFTELYKLDKKFDDKMILTNENKSIVTSSNFELLFTFNLTDKSLITRDRLYFISDYKIHIVNKKDLK